MGYTGPTYSGTPAFPDTGKQSAKYAYRSTPRMKKYREVLPYWVFEVYGTYRDNLTAVSRPLTDWGGYPVLTLTGSSTVDTSTTDYAKAFDRFWSKVTRESGSADLGVTIAEYRSSLNMLSNRSTQLITAIGAIRKGNFGALMEALDLSKKDKRGQRVWKQRNVATYAPGQLLEYTFGWVPLVNDMRAACKVLSSTPEYITIIGSSSSVSQNNVGSQENYLPSYVRYLNEVQRRVVLKGDVRIDNPNLDLANRLGLVNPITLAWDLIPYSFLVNQFIGVSQYLDRFTASWGRTVVNGMRSEKIVIVSTRESRAFNETWGYLQDSTTWKQHGKSFVRQPVDSFSRPTILPQFRLPVTDLLGRAITTTALLLQQVQGRNFREQRDHRALMSRSYRL